MFDALVHLPATEHPELLGEPVRRLIHLLPEAQVFAIDPALSDTEALCRAYGEDESTCANCVIVRGRRGEDVRTAACLALATTRVDVNRLVRRRLDVRKCSFAPMDDAVAESGMEYGAITPVGLPAAWPIWIDSAVAAADQVCIGAGTRAAKLIVPGRSLLALPGAELVEHLAS
ncbi:Aminoacyl-tRNA editing domain [Propionibacterium ruminifibrarum]|uniref:Aminoacyl-tRNA editing domain n=1 Tax=Propionibacterium ruminifibrarum TaxID=1962131 RepID=A0A375I403_9ACTN|nr:YbaK/EbsC family protein [Propionibacterium ruminifibrarum]SPF67923.1 Aminoacyl-tRNA editing domain [Propionibacterium ruminifibrarum]